MRRRENFPFLDIYYSEICRQPSRLCWRLRHEFIPLVFPSDPWR